MTAPTKEQISEIMSKIPSAYVVFCVWGRASEVTECIITEWEKMKEKSRRTK